MDIIVCLNVVPGVVTNVSIAEAGDGLKLNEQFLHMNETDEYALEEALVLVKENGGNVSTVTVGLASAEDILFHSLGKGANKAIRIDESPTNCESTALLLTEAIRRFNFDLILTGLESSADLASQVGVSVAERLGIPFVFAVTQIEITSGGKVAQVTRELGGGTTEVVEVVLPALLAIQTGIQKLSYAPVSKIFQARRRGVECVTGKQLGIESEQLRGIMRPKFIEILTPEVKRQREFLQGEPKDIALATIAKIIGAL